MKLFHIIEEIVIMQTRVKVITNSQLIERDINEALYNLGDVNIKDIKLYKNGVLFTILIIYETSTES